MLNRQLYTALGNVGPLVLVTNVGAALRVIDVHRGLVADLRLSRGAQGVRVGGWGWRGEE